MALKKVTAIFDSLKLAAVEAALARCRVKGFTVQEVRRRGAYFDSTNRDPLTYHTLMEVYTSEANVAPITRSICEVAQLGLNHDGLVSVIPVEQMCWINEGKCCEDSDFQTGTGDGN